MTTLAASCAATPVDISRLVRAGLVTAASDGCFATILSVWFYGSTFARLWQGVASVLLGPASFEGGARTTAIGLLMHVGVAFAWSTVFFLLFTRTAWMRGLVSRAGVVGVAAIYGPFIWMVMSLVVIPLLVHRPPTITYRWFVQLVGHIPFVALPIVWSIAGRHSWRDAARVAAHGSTSARGARQ